MRLPTALLVCAALAPAIPAQVTVLAPEVVTAARTPQPLTQVPFSLQVFPGETLQAIPAATVDGALRSLPGFSLFRRSDSLTANPTAQGVSLRGLGPSGASRSLIVLDGVPLNDPFGGWVAWTLVPRESLARAELVRGGGATAWGNAALGGVVQLVTAGPETKAQARFSALAGDFSTRSAELSATLPLGKGSVQLSGRAFATDGFSLVAAERRGPIDVDAASRHSWGQVRWRQPLGENLDVALTARTFSERRNNGTPYQRNASQASFGSIALAGQPEKNFAWTAVAYAQDQGFSSTFSSVNATRTAETPASDQFAVPASALGAAWTGTWTQLSGARTTAGADVRRVRGETRERFTFVSGAFTRLRVAGGAQKVGGLFALHEQPLLPTLRLLIGGRVDGWRDDDGHRRESDLATGVASRDDRYAEHTGNEFNPSAGLVWTPTPAWRLRAAAQQAFRRPTLNELYRPFRQGANVTEANPALAMEHVTSGEIAAEWTLFKPDSPQPPSRITPEGITLIPFAMIPSRPVLTLGAAFFWNDLHDAVGNVTIARGPGTFPIVGTLAAGGLGRQRLNLERSRVQGLELSAYWFPIRAFSLSAEFLYNDATVRRATVAPALVGKRIAQVPRQSASLGATWRAPGKLTFTPRLRWIGRQLEDDENQLILGEVVIVDFGVTRPLGEHAELFLNAENLGNARNETGRSADGVVNVGTPRYVFGGVRLKW